MGFKTWAYVVDVRLVNRLPLTSTQPTELARLTQPYHHDTSISSCKELQKRIVLDQLHDATLLLVAIFVILWRMALQKLKLTFEGPSTSQLYKISSDNQ